MSSQVNVNTNLNIYTLMVYEIKFIWSYPCIHHFADTQRNRA